MKKTLMYTSIPKDLCDYLIDLSIAEPLLNLDVTFGVIGLIYKKQFIENKASNLIGLNCFINLDSRLLIKYDLKGVKATAQLKLLEKLRIIDISPERFNVKGGKGKARGYKIIFDFKSGILQQIPLNKKVSKSIHSLQIQRKNNADYTTEHLTKWISNKYFKINKEKAIKYLDEVYIGKDSITKNKKTKRLHSISNFENQIQTYSREGKDNRLHSCFSNLPSDLKQFVLCNDQSLLELDVKSSQPFILSIILEAILDSNEYVKTLKDKRSERLIKTLNKRIKKRFSSLNSISMGENNYDIKIDAIINRVSIILIEDSECIDFVEVCNFISDIRCGDIYNKTGKDLLSKQVIKKVKNFYVVNLYDQNKNRCRDFDFSTLRDCAKHVVLNSIYANFKNPKNAVKEFRSIYPSTMMILDQFKADDYKNLAILMQRIESNAILDYSAKKIAQKLPNAPLITRHDSLSTTSDMIKDVKELFLNSLNDFFNCDVPVVQKAW